MGHTKDSDGFYHIKGSKYELLCGSRAQVLHGTAYKTTGGLTKSDLIQNKNGRIVSRKKHNHEKKIKRLAKHGYTAKKGKFGAVRMSTRSRGGTTSVNSMDDMLVSKSAMNAINPTGAPIITGGKRGGYVNGSLNPAGAQSNSTIMAPYQASNPMRSALMAGAGKSRVSGMTNSMANSMSNSMSNDMSNDMLNGGKRGGYPNSVMNPAGANSNFLINAPYQEYNPMRAALMAGGKRRGKRGGYSGYNINNSNALSPAGAHANYQLSNGQGLNNPANRALLASGGRKTRGKKSRGRKTRGGSLQMTPLNDAYQGLNQYVVPQSFTPQMNALSAGV